MMAAGAAAVPVDEQDNEMEAQERLEIPSMQEDNEGWIESVSKATRRKNRASLDSTAQQLSQTPPKAIIRPDANVTKPRPPPLPKEDFKMVIRPKEGLNLRKQSPALLSESILSAAQITWREAELRVRVDPSQNILTISTPHKQAARALNRITQLVLQGKTYPVSLYGLSPHDSCKGIIHNIPQHYSMKEVLEDLWLPGTEFLTCRRLGSTATVLITILGNRVPFYVYYKGVETRCYVYKQTIPYCHNCHETGHRTDVCPTPNATACAKCGRRNPEPDHPCTPKCSLCQGEHLTASKHCPRRFKEPYYLRRKNWEKDASGGRERSRSRGSSQGRRSSRSRSRSKSTAPSGRSQSKQRATTTTGNQETPTPQVSWSQILSTTAPPKPTCNECTNLQKEVTCLRSEIASLKAAISQLTQSNTSAQPPQAVLEKKRKISDASETTTPNHAPTPTQIDDVRTECQQAIEKHGQIVNEQLGAIIAQVSSLAQIMAQCQQTNTLILNRLDHLDSQTTPSLSRSSRKEKPYHRLTTTDTADKDLSTSLHG